MLSKAWKTFYVPVQVGKKAQQGVTDMQLIFLLGGLPQQHLQIAELEVVNYQDKVNANALPMTKVKYFGIEENSPWRAQAQQRINKNRKANVELNFVDANNQPLKNTHINVELLKHDYNFGCGFKALEVFNSKRTNEEDRAAKLKNIKSMCNFVVFNNALKWPT